MAARIRERTAGNPFFIEEVVRSLEETGTLVGTRGAWRLERPVDTIVVPAMVQAVLAARIDRLAEREKTVVQTAAVIGQEFGEGLLGRVTGLPEPDLTAALRALVAAEFLYASALFPETEYTFTHPLTQEVAYGSQLAERRARVHAAIGAVMEQTDTERLDEHAALLAHHWEGAGDALRAARWHRRAATWLRRGDLAEARRHLDRVRALVAGLPDSPERAELGVMASVQLLDVGSRLGLPEDEARALFEQGRTVAAGDPRALAALHAVYQRFRGANLGDMQAWLDLGREAVRLADQAGDRELWLAAHVTLIMPLQHLGRVEAGRAPARVDELHAQPACGAGDLRRLGRKRAACLSYLLGHPVLLPTGPLKLGQQSGVQTSAQNFDSIKVAPTSGYNVDSAQVVHEDSVLILMTRASLCQSIVGFVAPYYAKLHVLAIDTTSTPNGRRIDFVILSDLNCGFRGLEEGLPHQ